MSQGIQERNLPVAESIGEGDKVRIVTSAGNSKNVDASQIGGGSLKLEYTMEETSTEKTYTFNRTYNELLNAINNGIPVYTVGEMLESGHVLSTAIFLSGAAASIQTPLFVYLDEEGGETYYCATFAIIENQSIVTMDADATSADDFLVSIVRK